MEKQTSGSQDVRYTSDNLPAAFWEEYPENVEENVDLAAINAILEESTPDERAETYKARVTFSLSTTGHRDNPGRDFSRVDLSTIVQGQGNDALKRGLQLKKKFYLREAVNLYTKGLEMDCSMPELLSILLSNRAQAHLLLENYRSALDDSLEAVRINGGNLKVCMVYMLAISYYPVHSIFKPIIR